VIKEICVLIVAVLVAIASPALAEEGTRRTVEQYTCKDIMREGGTNRDAAIAFLHGYVLGKSGQSSFDLNILTEQTDNFMDRCLDHPNVKAIEAMLSIKK
jgi:hypothetical protein